MKRRLSGRSSGFTEEAANPMDGVANLADVMLCLAVGIMLALVLNWNVDLTYMNSGEEPPASAQNTPLPIDGDDITPAGEGDTPLEADMKKLGMVYYDEKTGTYYLVELPADTETGEE
ncbi:MAG: DUF2149 domain-containing protein [Oscillospiraceae bacterium]|jgi:hypothetical protein|nr:DUF2149 domain-containing protein [Oscillospiraceae bacterium]